MIRLDQILTPERCVVGAPGGSKKKVLEFAARLLGNSFAQLDQNNLLDCLNARERLGSTGFGNGIAIPHCRLSGCDQPVGALIHLQTPVDFDAIDGAPVDLLFVLLVPETATDEHLELLRQIASIFDQDSLRDQLRAASNARQLYQLFLQDLPTAGRH